MRHYVLYMFVMRQQFVLILQKRLLMINNSLTVRRRRRGINLCYTLFSIDDYIIGTYRYKT